MAQQQGELPPGPGAQFARAVEVGARWSLRLLLIAAGLAAVLWVASQFWSMLLPLLLTTVLWPPARLLRRWLPPSLAALLALVVLLALIAGRRPRWRWRTPYSSVSVSGCCTCRSHCPSRS